MRSDLIATTLGLPSLRVPALSKATVPVSATVSMALQPSKSTPLLAAPDMAHSRISGSATFSTLGLASTSSMAARRTDSWMVMSNIRGSSTRTRMATTVTIGVR